MIEPTDDPLDRFLGRVGPDVPDDAAERVLRGLEPALVSRRLFWAEVARAARPAAFASALLALAGTATLVVSLHTRPARHVPLHVPVHAAGARPLALAEATRALDAARRLAVPFPLEGRK